MCPEPWPSLGIITTKLDTCARASILLKGEQKLGLLFGECKQHATPCTPHTIPSLSLNLVLLRPGILTHKTPHNEDPTSVRCTTDECHLEGLACMAIEMQEPGGVLRTPSIKLAGVIANAKPETEAAKSAIVEAHEPGGV